MIDFVASFGVLVLYCYWGGDGLLFLNWTFIGGTQLSVVTATGE